MKVLVVNQANKVLYGEGLIVSNSKKERVTVSDMQYMEIVKQVPPVIVTTANITKEQWAKLVEISK